MLWSTWWSKDWTNPRSKLSSSHLRRRGPGERVLFLLTRSCTILDLVAVGADEAIILCPANHSPPTRVAPYPGAPGYEAVATCLASPDVRARRRRAITHCVEPPSGVNPRRIAGIHALIQIRDFGVDAQQLWNCARVAPAKTAFRGDGEFFGVFLRRRQPLLRAIDAVGVMDEAQAELGFGP